MKIVIQRVKHASVSVDGEPVSKIDSGMVLFLGISIDDQKKQADYLINKIVNLRIFEDENNRMNCSALELKKELLVISQFTLYGNCAKGRRPSFTMAMEPKKAEKLYRYFVDSIKNHPLSIKEGVFGAHMDISLINDGPVTFIIDSV